MIPKLTMMRDARGSVAPIFAISMVVLFGVAGMGVDWARAVHLRSSMQSAVDAATLAAAAAPAEKIQSVGAAYFGANFKDGQASDVSVSFAVQGANVQGTVNGTVKTTLLQIFKIDTIPVSAVATAGLGAGTTTTTSTTTTTPGSNVCLLLLSPDASQSLLVNSGANVNTNTCEIHVKSTASSAAVFNAASKVLSAKLCIEGTSVLDNGGTHPNLQKNCRTAADPFAGKLPVPSSAGCTFSNLNYNGGTVNLSPGVYCGWFNFNNKPNVKLAPGVYVIKGGGWNVDGGTWTGTGVTFYYADSSKIQFNSGIASSMHAPTSGTYNGILMYEASGLARSPFVLDDSMGSDLSGLIYLPSRDVIFNSASKAMGEPVTMVFNTLILDDTDWDINTATLNIPATPPVTTTTTTTTTTPGHLSLVR